MPDSLVSKFFFVKRTIQSGQWLRKNVSISILQCEFSICSIQGYAMDKEAESGRWLRDVNWQIFIILFLTKFLFYYFLRTHSPNLKLYFSLTCWTLIGHTFWTYWNAANEKGNTNTAHSLLNKLLSILYMIKRIFVGFVQQFYEVIWCV